MPKEVEVVQSVSYKPTGLNTIDALLNRVDLLTRGKAGTIQHVTTYLISGGLAAIVNLTSVYLIYNVLVLPIDDRIHFILAYCIAEELSILTNFSVNDRVTFTHLPGHARRWQYRLARFHMTCFTGLVITFSLSYSLHYYIGLAVIIAQAVAIMLTLVVNFALHHFWTYRKIASVHQ